MVAPAPTMSSSTRQIVSTTSSSIVPSASAHTHQSFTSGSATKTRSVFLDGGTNSGFERAPYYSLPTATTSYERDHSNYEHELYLQQTTDLGLRRTSSRKSRLVSVNYAEDDTEVEESNDDMASLKGNHKTPSMVSDTGDVDFELNGDEIEPVDEDEAGAVDAEMQTTPSKKKNAGKGTTKKGHERSRNADKEKIGATYEELTEADKLLFDLRKEGRSFNDIKTEIEQITGIEFAASSLPNRYGRIRVKLANFETEDDNLLLRCTKAMFETYEAEKWEMVKEMIIKKGGQKFGAKALADRYAQLKAEKAEHSVETDKVDVGDAGMQLEEDED